MFVVQLGGSKRWRIWAPLPRTADPVKGRHPIAAPRLDELGDPLLDLTLEAGDCLYLPRGYPHAAETTDQPSDHLTIGLLAVTWQRVLHKAIDAEVAARAAQRFAAGRDARARRGGERVEIELDGLRRAVSPETLRHWMAREIWRRQPATRLRPLVAPATRVRVHWSSRRARCCG